MTVAFVLPFPVSVNQYWRSPVINGAPRTMISAKGRAYSDRVLASVLEQRPDNFRCIAVPIKVTMCLNQPDRRRRDLDNTFKVLFDALTRAKVWGDDSQVHHINAHWGGVLKGGRVSITIEEYTND